MANGKKSFVAYIDWGSTFDELDDNEAGQLIKLLFDYVRDKEPEPPSKLIKIAFEHIKQDLKRDLKKWVGYIEKQQENGKKGGRPKETQKTQAFSENPTQPKKADNVLVNVLVNDNVNVNEEIGQHEKKEMGLGVVVWNAEEEILKNEVRFQEICSITGNNFEGGKKSLHKYHLFLEEKEQYPKGKKAIFAGFEKWLLNEKKFNSNGKQQISTADKSVGRTIQFDKP